MSDNPQSSTLDFVFDVSGDDDLTSAVNLQGRFIESIIMPAAWTAASVVPHLCETSGGTYQVAQMPDSADTIEIYVAAGQRTVVIPTYIIGDAWVKLESVTAGTPGTPVGQAADRTLTVKVRAV